MNSTTEAKGPAGEERRAQCQWHDIGFSRFRVSAKAKSKKRHHGNNLSLLKSFQPEIKNLDGSLFVPPPLSANFQKSNFLLGQTIDGIFNKSQVERWLFVTLTFADGVRSTREAHRRLNSLLNKVRSRYGTYLWVMQPQESGRIHYHLIVPVDFWTHDGVDLDPWRKRNSFEDSARLAAMSPRLREESNWWTSMAAKYGFGRVEVAPIYGDAAGIQKYLTRHEWRHRHCPFEETKSFQFWNCSRSLKAGNTKFAFHNPGATRYRQELQEFAARYGIFTLDHLVTKMGPHWSWRFRMWRECRQFCSAA